MKKNLLRYLAVIAALVFLMAGCSAPPTQEPAQEAEDSQNTQAEQSSEAPATPTAERIPPENVLFIASQGNFPIMAFILTMDYNTNSLRFTNFYYKTQIEVVTKEGEEVSMPMDFLGFCETPQIVEAYENTYGIKIDKYLIFKYDNKKVIEILNELSPVKLDIPEEFMGDEEFSSINGNIKFFGEELDIEGKPIDQVGEQELDSLGLFSFFHTIPESVFASDDRLKNMMGDYKLWDEKNQMVIAMFNPLLKTLGEDAVKGLWKLVTQGQDTDITDEDIAKWSKLLVSLPGEVTPYFTVPGFEGVEMEDFDADDLMGVSGFSAKMLTYDNETMSENLQKFINAE